MSTWDVLFHVAFAEELASFSAPVRMELVAMVEKLRAFGPRLGRPHVDTLKGSKHSNMKELRFEADGGVWRAAFAFDPKRRAIVLVAGDKSGGSQKAFYRRLLATADERFDHHLDALRRERNIDDNKDA